MIRGITRTLKHKEKLIRCNDGVQSYIIQLNTGLHQIYVTGYRYCTVHSGKCTLYKDNGINSTCTLVSCTFFFLFALCKVDVKKYRKYQYILVHFQSY